MSLPRKWQESRTPSRPTLHKDVALTSCDHPLKLRFSWSADYAALVLYVCERCEIEHFTHHEVAPAIAKWGVLPDTELAWDTDDDEGGYC